MTPGVKYALETIVQEIIKIRQQRNLTALPAGKKITLHSIQIAKFVKKKGENPSKVDRHGQQIPG